MPGRGFKVSAVVLGFLVDVAATLLGAVVLGVVAAVSLVQGGASPDAIQSHLATSGPFVVCAFAVGLAATSLGGHVAARLARHARYRHAVALGAASLLLGALSAEGPSAWPWLDAAGYLLVVPAALLGAYFAPPQPDTAPSAALASGRTGGAPC